MPRTKLKNYGAAIAMWERRYDTYEIARELGIGEPLAAAWIANYRDLMASAGEAA
jgi:hypothetical protein